MERFNFKKKYGQNFLTNDTIAEKIVTRIAPTDEDLIIEIGPGSGVLTRKLKRYNASLIAFEIDKDTDKYLSKLEDNKTKVFYEDFMNIDVKSIIDTYKYNKLYIVSNLPYYITTPILERIIDLKLSPEAIVIMVQKEVGERFLAKPHTKNYGYMTVLLQYSFTSVKVVDVSRSNFNPMPNVDSMVIKMTKGIERDCDYDRFKELLKTSFRFKRKTLNNNLKDYNKVEIARVLNKHNYTLQNRAEDIDIDTYVELTSIVN